MTTKYNVLLYSIIIILCLIIPASAYDIIDDTVYIDNENVYLSATPHTISSSGWVYFNLTSKQFSGNIDTVWGFNTTVSKPTKAELYSPHWVNTTSQHSHTFYNVSSFEVYTGNDLDYGNSYNTNYSYTAVHEVITYDETTMEPDGLEWVTSNASFDSFDTDGTNYTIYWHNRHDKWVLWKDKTNTFNSITHDYQGYDKWYYIKDVSVNAGQSYLLRAWVEVPISLKETSGKYYFAVKPSSETIPEAIAAGHFYALDPWWNSSWNYYKTITINQSMVNQSIGNVHFPTLVSITDADLADHAQADGDDIVFTNSGNTTQLPHEIEYWNKTTGELVAWVNVSDIVNVSSINMYYNNSGATDSQNAAGVWDSNYVMVQHLNETPANDTAGHLDSTFNDNDGTPKNFDSTATSTTDGTGQIDGADIFDGVNDYVSINEIFNATNHFVSLWVYPRDINASLYIMEQGTDDRSILVGFQPGYFNFYSDGYPTGTAADTQFVATLNTWQHIVMGTDGTKVYAYKNGVKVVEETGQWDIPISGVTTLSRDAGEYFNGTIDEVRISNTARSAPYIQTDYNNTAYPSLFISLSGEQDASYFNSTWNTSLTSTGSSNSDQVHLPLESTGTYDFRVWWGDGTNDTITTWNQAEVNHTYASEGEYDIQIEGTIIGWRFNNVGDKLKLLNITNWGNLNLGNSNGYFYGCSNLNVGADDTLDLTGTTNLAHAFRDCSALISLDVSNWDVSSVASFNQAFYGCSGLTSLNTTYWNTGSVTTFSSTFYGCSGLTSLNTTYWNTGSVTTFSSTFRGCIELTSLDTSNWNTSSVTTFYSAFRGCIGLTSLDTTNWDTSSVTTFYFAFEGCSGLTSLNTSNWNITSLTDATYMFNGVTLNTTNYNDLLIGWAAQSLNNDVPFHGGNSLYSCDAESARNDTLIGTFNWSITDGGLTGGPCPFPPTITKFLVTPSTINTNYTGTITISYLVSSSDPLNLSSLAFLYGLNYTIPAGGDMHNYISGPPNSIAYDGLYRAPHRNTTPYLSWEYNTTITNNNVWQWGGYDNDSTELTTNVINATHTWVNVTGVTEDVLASSFYLSKSEMYDAPKTGFEVSRAQGLIFKMWNVEEIRNRDANYLANLYFDTMWEGTEPTHPIEIGYCNDSYNPATDDIDVSPYCVKFGEWNGTRWIDHSWSPGINASYASPLTINASQFTDPTPTDVNYIWLRSYTISSKSYVLNATDYDPGICNRSFAQTNTMWTYNEINGQTDAIAYTPSFFTTFARNDEDLLHHLYVADDTGEWGHSEIFNESIGLSTVPVPPVSFEHFNTSCGTVYVNDTQMDATYNNGTMDIYIHCPADPDGGPVSHNITLHYGNNQSFVSTINNTLTTTGDEYVNIIFNTTPHYSSSDYYTLKCVSTDDEGSVATKWLISDFTLDADGNQGWISNGEVHFWGFNDIPTLYTTISNNSLLSYSAGDDVYTMHIPFFKSQYNDTFNFNETVHLKSLNNEDVSYFRFVGKTIFDNATIIGWNTTSDTPAPITDTYRSYVYSLTTTCGNITNSNFSYMGSDFYRQEGLNFVDNSHEYLIHNTTLSHNAEGPIMEECNNFTISNCTITDNVNVGVGVYFTNNTIVENNTISSNGGRGVSVYEGNDNTIQYNEIIDSGVHGIHLWSNSGNNTCTGNDITGSGLYDYYLSTSSFGNYLIDPASATDKIRVTSTSSLNIENTDNAAFSEDSLNTSYAYLTNFSMYVTGTTHTFNITQHDMAITPSTDNLSIWNLVFASSVSFNASSDTASNPTWYNITNSSWANYNILVYRNDTLFANETADATGFMDYNYSDSYSEKWFEFTLGSSLNLDNFSFTNISVSPTTVLQGHPSTISIDISDFDGTINTAIVKIKDTNYTMANTVGDTWSYTYSNNYVGKHYITDFYAQDNNLAWNSTTSTSYINILDSSGSGGNGFVIVPTPTPTITPEPTPTPTIEKELNITLPTITIITDESINIFKLVNWFGKTKIESTVEADGIVQCIINDGNNLIDECDVYDGVILFTFNPVIDNIYNTNMGTITMIDDTGNEHKTNVALSTFMWWPLLIIVGLFYILIKIYTKL